MTRRGGNSQLEFGSDSFLDIVANIVGILIILIVIAGVRVSQAPLREDEGDKMKAQESRQSSTTDHGPRTTDHRPPATEPPTTEPRATEPRANPESLLQNQLEELAIQARALEADIDEIEAQTQTLVQLAGQWNEREEDLRLALSQIETSRDEKQQAAQLVQERTSMLKRNVDQIRVQLSDLKVELIEEEKTNPPVKTLPHRLTPLSKTVHDKELHFRLIENRIAHVPLDEMLERLKAQVERQKNWLMKFNRHQGTIGPVEGFTMNYVVVRQQVSVIEELRQGKAMMRIGVSQWQIEPEPDLHTESAQEALKPGSRFYHQLMQAEPETTLTFWVYPDSFSLFRQLQAFAHREGFTVAARPLPFGIPIAGSPSGSRSAGQ